MYETLVVIASALALLGLPSLFVIAKTVLKVSKDLKFVSSAIKSQIRNDLIKDFDVYNSRGWASLVEQTEWINRYNNYHNLYGDNGVLDNKYLIMTNIPNSPQPKPKGN